MTTLTQREEMKATGTLQTSMSAGRAMAAPRTAPDPTATGSLQRAWRDVLADEERAVAPWERMALALLTFASVGAILASVGATSRLVERLPVFNEWVGRLLGTL